MSLIDPWRGPHGGLPEFDRVRVADLSEAVAAGMTLYREEIRAIADDPSPPTFANTCGALDRAGEALARVTTYYQVWASTMKADEVRALEAELEPKLSALGDEVVQNEKLFARLAEVHGQADPLALSLEERRVVHLRHLNFTLRGARLEPAAKRRVAEINQRLATLFKTFESNVIADDEKPALICERASELSGMSPSFVAAARAEAERRGLGERWVIANTRSSAEPFLTYAHDRAAREAVFRVWTARGEGTNEPIAREILNLRRERADLFGYPSHAHWRLADKMISTPQAALDLMNQVWAPAVAQVRRDVRAMQAIIENEGGGFKLAPWDYRYYAERVRKARFDLDFDQVRPYMRFENVRDAMFEVARRLYGLEFAPLGGVPVYHPDVTAFTVTRGSETVGVFYLDPYARPGKVSGAWMCNYRDQSVEDGRRRPPIVANTLNLIKPGPGQPTLITWDDARTMFHEFGHALHGLNSDVSYAYVQGTHVPTDYVEFPSHFHENYLTTPEVLGRLVNENGEPLPPALVEKLEVAKTFNLAFGTVEFLACAIVDMRLHLQSEDVDPAAFAADVLNEIGMPDEIVMRHRLPHFAHIFSGDHYSAGYYSYLWSDVMASDGFAAFTEAGGPYDPVVAKRLLDFVLSVGNSVEPAEGYRRFRGRAPGVDALLRARGLADGVTA